MNLIPFIHRKTGRLILIEGNKTMIDLHRQGIRLTEYIRIYPTPTLTTNE
jgi:hypothetical protein